MNVSFPYATGLVLSIVLHAAAVGGVLGLSHYGVSIPEGDGFSGIVVSFSDGVEASEDGCLGGRTENYAEPVSSRPPGGSAASRLPDAEELVHTGSRRVEKKVVERAEGDFGAESRSEKRLDQGRTVAPSVGGGAMSKSGAGDRAMFRLGGGSGATRAVPVVMPKPPYPARARQSRFEGQVALEVVIGTTGEVKEAKVVKSSSREDCDASARKTLLENWRFEPARLDGRPIEWRETVLVSYRLR